MNKNIRILTYHHITNFGAALFSLALQQLVSSDFNTFEVKILDYRSKRLSRYENLKLFKLHSKAPLFYLERRNKFNEFVLDALILDQNFKTYSETDLAAYLHKENFEIIITAMDVWNITNIPSLPNFPNIYWLPVDLPNPTVAFSVSAYRSKKTVLENVSQEITRQLSKFSLIGVRDNFTYELVEKYLGNQDIPLLKIPDPTMLYKIKPSGVKQKLKKLGIDFTRPILGLSIYGQNQLVKDMVTYYKMKGYQVIALGMYHRHASINLGHKLSPHEWAESFKYLSFCITDRYHGTIFCLKNNVPFVCLEPSPLEFPTQSKLLDLLNEFKLPFCYFYPHNSDFDHQGLLSTMLELETTWDKQYSMSVTDKLHEQQKKLTKFLKSMHEIAI